MAKKNMFNAETAITDRGGSMVIDKKAVISYLSLIPKIQAHGRSMSLSNKGFSIGRDKSNSVIVSDPRVSKFHAHVTFKRKSAFIQDSKSTNGTWVNKVQISDTKPQLLKNGDIIVVGKTELLFKC